MKKNLSRGLLLILIFVSIFSTYSFGEELDIQGRTKAYLVGDYITGEILESYNIDEPIEIASITKIMSYLVVADEVKAGNISLNDTIYIDLDTARVAGSSLKLKPGEILTVEQLLEGLMVVSGNDATYALAKHTFETEDQFVKQMGAKASELGLTSAEFYNSTGLPVPNGDGNREDRKQNKMSPSDIFTLTRHIIKTHPEVLELSSKQRLVIPERNFDKGNTNDLLQTMDRVDGFKTGFTDKAGYCLVSTMRDGLVAKDSRLISVVMGTRSGKERSAVTRHLLEYACDKYESKVLLDKTKPIKVIPMKKVEGGYLKIYPKENFKEIVDRTEHVDMEIKLNRFLSPSFKKGEVVGQAMIYSNNEIVKEIDLVTNENIIKDTFFGRIFGKIRFMFSKG